MKAFIRSLAGFACLLTLAAALHAQSASAITVIVLDGRTGAPVKPSNYMLRANRHDDLHNEWLHLNDDGSALVTLPDGVTVLSLQATYDSSMETYVGCDGAKEKVKNDPHWYPVPDILKTGIVAANQCGKAHLNPKPGVFAIYVRKRDWRDSPMN